MNSNIFSLIITQLYDIILNAIFCTHVTYKTYKLEFFQDTHQIQYILTLFKSLCELSTVDICREHGCTVVLRVQQV